MKNGQPIAVNVAGRVSQIDLLTALDGLYGAFRKWTAFTRIEPLQVELLVRVGEVQL